MLSLLLQVALGVVCLFLVWLIGYILMNSNGPMKGLPTLDYSIPILGHFFQVQKNTHRFHDFLREASQKFPPLASWTLGGLGYPPLVYVQGEANVKHMLKDNFDNYSLSENRNELLEELFGHGIFGVNGEAWRSQRKAASHIFSFRQLNDHMSHIIVEHVQILQQILTSAMESNKPIDMQKMFFRLTMDSFTEWAFGEKLNSLTQEHVPFAHAFDTCQRLLLCRIFDPFWKAKRVFGLGAEGNIKKQLKILDDFAYRTINRRREAFQSASSGSGLEAGSSLISWYIREAKKTGKTLSDKELRDVLLNFMVAGRDTTAVLLSWFAYELTQHPEVEAKILEEIKSVLADPTLMQDDEAVSGQVGKYLSLVRSSPYLEAALLETLRLHPSVPQDDREALADDTFPDGTRVPKGTSVSFSPYIAGRNPALWGADCCEFKPSRWLREDSQVPVRDAYSQYFFPAFSAGPRLCLGKTLAITEAKLAMIMLLEKFSFSLAEQPPVSYEVTITLNVKNGLLCNIHPRV